MIAAGLHEAIAVARGIEKPARMHAAGEIDVKAIRRKTGLSQQEFAYSYGFTMEQIRSWEQKRARPLGGVRVYLMMIDTDPGVGRILEAARNRHAAYSLPSLRAPTSGNPRSGWRDRSRGLPGDSCETTDIICSYSSNRRNFGRGTKRGPNSLKMLGRGGKITARPKSAPPARPSPSVGILQN